MGAPTVAAVEVARFRLGDRVQYHGFAGEVIEHEVDGTGLDGHETYRIRYEWAPGCPHSPVQTGVGARLLLPVRLPRPQADDWLAETISVLGFEGICLNCDTEHPGQDCPEAAA